MSAPSRLALIALWGCAAPPEAPVHDRGAPAGRGRTVYDYLETPDLTLSGSESGARFGRGLSVEADVNGDGYDDLVLSASGEGSLYAYHGGPDGIGDTPDSSATKPSGLLTWGYPLSSAGDFNGDGYDDIVLTAQATTTTNRVYLYLGSASGLAGASTTYVSGTRSTGFGNVLAALGDIDDDGYDDVAIGAPTYDATRGAVYVYLGAASGLTLDDDLLGDATTLYFGCSVDGIGDITGDGRDDAVIGAYGYGASMGRTTMHHGRSTGLYTSLSYDLYGESDYEYLGSSVAGIGDANGDGYLDYAALAHSPYGNSVSFYVEHGEWGYLYTLLEWEQVFVPDLVTDDGRSGVLVGAGDLNGDGYDDTLFGTELYGDGLGLVQLYMGSEAGLDETAAGSVLGTVADDDFGEILSAGGDLNGDGYADFALSRAQGSPSAYTGAVDLYYGQPDADGDGYVGAEDCDDLDADTWPGAPEVVGDGKDQDCDGTEICYTDADGDRYRTDDELTSSDTDCSDAGEARSGHTAGDCDDADEDVNPGATELTGDGVDGDCDGHELCYTDSDADGWSVDAELVSEDADCEDAGELATLSAPEDCDDADPNSHPSGDEVAGDGVDGDCDGYELCYVDSDGDGHIPEDPETVASADLDCAGEGEADAEAPGGDCDDEDPLFNPSVDEIPGDEIDQDCDGVEDCYVDDDDDAWALDTVTARTGADMDCNDAGEAHEDAPAGDCADEDPTINPGASETVGDGIDQDCDGSETCYIDADGDGYRSADGGTVASADEDCEDDGEAAMSASTNDCDDTDATLSVEREEIPADGIDQDCDGTELCYVDDDEDGYLSSIALRASEDLDCDDEREATGEEPLGDCNDLSASAHPGGTESTGDNLDGDCDGYEWCYTDEDEDGYRGDEAVRSDDDDCEDDGEALWMVPEGDCDDTDPAISPEGEEVVGDEVDGDCDEGERCWLDADGDGYRPDEDSEIRSSDADCDDAGEAGAAAGTGDCDDGDPSVSPEAAELAGDEVDSDCDGVERCLEDADGDGYGSGETLSSSDADCADPGEAPATSEEEDCDDADASVSPAAEEIVGDGVDSDCDGLERCYWDADGDGYRPDDEDALVSADIACDGRGEADLSTPGGDCDDADDDSYPGAEEICDDEDNDCDGEIDLISLGDETLDVCADTDGDGVRDLWEISVTGTDPASSDTDGDGVPDSVELGYEAPDDEGAAEFTADSDPSTTTDPTAADTDGDGLLDGEEDLDGDGALEAGETDPNLADTDGDGASDAEERAAGTDPTVADGGADTGDTGDTGETTPGDSGVETDTGAPVDSDDTGPLPHSGDTGAPVDSDDTGPLPHSGDTAGEGEGEGEGEAGKTDPPGCGCGAAEAGGAWSGLLGALGLLAARRRAARARP